MTPHTEQTIIVWALLMIVAVWAIPLNIWYWRRRSKMTPAERKQEDRDAISWF